MAKRPKKKSDDDGRPTKYKEEYNKLAFNYSLLGATDKQMAEYFDVALSTLHKWKLEHPNFSDSLKEGKDEADANVGKALYGRALGYSHPDVDIKVVNGEIVETPITKHYPPDTTSCIFWLKNRQKDKWRDKHEIEQTGDAIITNVKIEGLGVDSNNKGD